MTKTTEEKVERLMAMSDTFCNASDSVVQMLGANAGMDEGNVYWVEMKRARASLEAALRTELVQGEVAPAHPPLIEGLTLVPCAIRPDGWLCVPHADNKWVTAAKLEPFSLAVINYWLKGRPTPQPAIAQIAQKKVCDA